MSGLMIEHNAWVMVGDVVKKRCSSGNEGDATYPKTSKW